MVYNKDMALIELIDLRMNKYEESKKYVESTFWQGYHEGWKCAYQDLKEILEQHNVNLLGELVWKAD